MLRARLGRPAVHPASAVIAKRADLSIARLAAARVTLEGLHEDRREREARLRSMLDLCGRHSCWPLCTDADHSDYAEQYSMLLRQSAALMPAPACACAQAARGVRGAGRGLPHGHRGCASQPGAFAVRTQRAPCGCDSTWQKRLTLSLPVGAAHLVAAPVQHSHDALGSRLSGTAARQDCL